MKKVLLVAIGQSNWQGAAKTEGGGTAARYRSIFTGACDPFPGCNNIGQGGSCFPYLIDLAYVRGVKLEVLNYVIGGASVFHYTGLVGSTVTGGLASLPASQGYMSPVALSGGSSAAVEGNGDFDPFSLLSRARAAITSRSGIAYDQIISYWVNGESDAGSPAAFYATGLVSVANYMLASGVSRHIIGLTSKSASASDANFLLLQQGVAQAVATLKGQGKPVSAGHDMYAYYGANPPLYPESDGTSYVHMTLRGQEVQASLANAALYQLGI